MRKPKCPATPSSLAVILSWMKDLELRIPREALLSIRLPPKELEGELRRRLAMALFSDGILSNAAACSMSGLGKAEFQRLLGERGIAQPLGESDLEEDLANLEAWRTR